MTIQADAETSLRSQPTRIATRNRTAIFTLTLLCALTLAGCGGGGGKDQVRIGSGQSPGQIADPTLVDFPIFYVKRPVPDFTKNVPTQDFRRERRFLAGADLYMRASASPSAVETNITTRITQGKRYDIKDVDTSWDGRKVIFAMRGPLANNQDEKDPPTWEIWEYALATDDLHRVIVSDVTAADGNDVTPHYLADGVISNDPKNPTTDRIIFTSTRQRDSKAILIDESSQGIGSSGYEAQDESNGESAFVVHVMDPDGSNIHQITFNQSHDVNPTLMANGRVLFSRWNHANGRNSFDLFTANPDGTDVQLLYGAQSHNTGSGGSTIQFVDAREMSDGKVLALVRPFTGTEFGGDLYLIDVQNYVENNQPTLANQGMNGPAQTKALPNDIRTVPGPSPGGRFNSAFPLADGSKRIITTWSQCRLLDMKSNNAIVPCTSSGIADASSATPVQYMQAPPLYSAWLFDPSNGTLRPIMQPEEGVMVSDIAASQPRTRPATIRDHVPGVDLDVNLVGEGVGILDINSVYDWDGVVTGTTSIAAVQPGGANFASRPARFLRLEKAVSLPDRDVRDVSNAAFGPTGRYMRQILGYIPVQPDGSVRAKVPANVAFQISVLDAQGRRIPSFSRHNGWLQLRPGEEMRCNGCHRPTPQVASQNGVSAPSGISHGRTGLFLKAYTGSAAGGNFPNANTAFIASAAGDTMARARAGWSCGNEQCVSITPSVNLIDGDVWPAGSDPHTAVAMPRAADIAVRYIGGGGLKTPSPTSSTCSTTWSSLCRIVINYEAHLQPLWDLDRPVVDAMGVPVVPAVDNKCTGCHSRVDAANATRVPAGQLELIADKSDNDPDHNTSYNELLNGDQQLQLNGGVLQPVCIQFGPIVPPAVVAPCVQFATVPAPMTAGSARASVRFFQTMEQGSVAGVTPTVDHRGFMTPGELKLVSEWLDIGAQYYNDPFKAPEN